MAKTVLRACDLCSISDGTTREDSTIASVRNTTVVGAAKDAGRKDLCDGCRYKVLITAGYTDEQATSIIAEHDKEKVRKPKNGSAKTETAEAVPSPPATDTAEAKANGKAKVPAGAK